MPTRLELEMGPQPDDTTCGPTCLHAVYCYYGDTVPLEEVIAEVRPLATGGTLAASLACHALRRGYGATIYTANLAVFDPTWFADPAVDIASKLKQQRARKSDEKLHAATRVYLEFLERGGRLRFRDFAPALIRRHLKAGQPILTGLSATYLYGCARESGDHELDYDDVGGEPVGHFVVLHGYDAKTRAIHVADPLQDNPEESHYYAVKGDRLIGAILLGVLTYDANLLILEPRT